MAKLIFLISMATAHAGWWSDWCERHLIADDPEQYADAPTSWLEHRIYYIEVMVRANMATKTDIRILKSLKKEMERRTHG